jgi:hypothetical protein
MQAPSVQRRNKLPRQLVLVRSSSWPEGKFCVILRNACVRSNY